MTHVPHERIALCDLLQGRKIRAKAWELISIAIETEARLEQHPCADARMRDAIHERVHQLLEAAAQWEWMATITEQGCIAWGRRINRCGPPSA